MKKISVFIFILGLLCASPAFAIYPGAPPADPLTFAVDASGFSGNLSTADDTLQKALDTIDAIALGGDTTETNQDDAWSILVDADSTFSLITMTYTDATNSLQVAVDPDLHKYTWTNVDGTDLKVGSVTQAYDADLTTYAGITPSANIQTFLGADDYAAMRTQLGLVIGTNVQAFDDGYTIAASVLTNDKLIRGDGGSYGVQTTGITVADTTDLMTSPGGITLDKGATNSPVFTLQDGDDATLAFTKLAAGGSTIVDSDGAIQIQASGDTNDYLTIATLSDVPTIATAGTSNLALAPDGGTVAITGAVTATSSVTAAGLVSNANLSVKNADTSAGVIAIYEDSDDGTDKFTLTIPALAADYGWTLPNALPGSQSYVRVDTDGTVDYSTGTASIAWDAIGDAENDATIAMGGYVTAFTTSLDNGAKPESFIISNTDSTLTNPSTLLALKHAADGSANGIFLTAIDATGATPNTVFSVKANGLVHTDTGIEFEGSTDDGTNVLYLTVADPGSPVTVTIPARTGNVLVDAANIDIGNYELRAQTLQADVATGTAPMTIASTTKVSNLNADLLDGSDWAAPPAIGSGTPAAADFTTIGASGLITASAGINIGTSQAIVGTTAMTIGNNGQTIAINSSDWDIDATGAMTGIGNITSNGTGAFTTLTEGGNGSPERHRQSFSSLRPLPARNFWGLSATRPDRVK